jgi:catechol 2,3-dioxygenase-like lactoylglutathione lyase family enzyme
VSHIPLTYGLTHIALAVEDLDRTRMFYQSVFNMEVMYDEANLLQLTTPGAHDILVFEKHGSVQSKDTGGIVHFGFRLRDADSIKQMHKRIRDAGGEILSKGEFVPGSPYIFFRDPDGYEVEVWYEAEVA